MKIVVLAGGCSTEREVSFMSASEIMKSLDKDRYEAVLLEIGESEDTGWIKELLSAGRCLVVNALHGGLGENGSIQGLLECAKIPYIGTGVLGSALCMDKAASKFIMKAHHIPVAEHFRLHGGENISSYFSDINRLGFPLVVKPNQGGSSVGVSIAHTYQELVSAIDKAADCGDGYIIERYISGTEVTCAVIETEGGPVALPVLDIEAAEAFYDYHAKYVSDETKIIPSRLPQYQRELIERIALQSFSVLGCEGYARIDMIVREENLYVLEVNTLPGMTGHSLVPLAASLAGMSFGQLMDRLISFKI
ncbi:MAG: D-alanine--D-alanine ligase, partial [Defluviitaleaceae bacterium]|nr:D-alanine--D-alanine ligase [Defluviitaleaceae bacterium]